MKGIALSMAADHPAYAGHFPGSPVLPGVVLLDAALRAVVKAQGCHGGADKMGASAGDGSAATSSGTLGTRGWDIANAKFQSMVQPGEALRLQHETLANGSVRFTIETGDRTVASGVLVPSATGRDRGQQS